MAYTRVRETDYNKAEKCKVAEFVADSNADIANLPKKNAEGVNGTVKYGACASGSTCHVLPGSEKFVGDGSTTTFVLSGIPYEEDIESVRVNGGETSAYTYDEESGTMIFTSAPGNGVGIAIKYDGNIRRLSPSNVWSKI